FYQLGPDAEFRRRRRLLGLLPRVETLLLFLLLLFGWLFDAGHINSLARQEHDRRYLLGLLVRNVFDDAEIFLCDEAARIDRAGEKRLHPVEMVLRPGRHMRMIVALGAANVHAKKGRADVDRQSIRFFD